MSSDPNVYMPWFWVMFIAGAVIGVLRFLSSSVTPPPYVPPHTTRGLTPTYPDPDAVEALRGLGFSRAAAVGALNASGWAGNTLEERVTTALRTHPTYMRRTNGDIVREEAVAHLVSLGWSRRESIAALTNSTWGGPGDPSVEDMVTAALRIMPNRGMR